MTNDIRSIVSQFSSFEEFYQWFINEYEGASGLPKSTIEALYNTYKAEANAGTTGDWNSVLEAASNNNAEMSPEHEKWLDNQIANQRTNESRDYEMQMRDTSLISSANQLRSLGLSSSGVLQTGGVVSGVNTGAAAISKHSPAQLRQQQKINDYNNKMGLAKTLISAAGSMASSGIYGAAIGAVKHSASAIATQAAHSGLGALKAMEKGGSWSTLPSNFGAGNNSIIRDDGSLASWAK